MKGISLHVGTVAIFALVTVTPANLGADETDWTHIRYRKVNALATSTLVEKGKPKSNYSATKAFDEDMKTAWCEGKPDAGVGETLIIEFAPVWIYGFSVFHGFGKKQSLYENNNRVKDYEITFTYKDGKTTTRQGAFKDGVCGKTERGGPCEYCWQSWSEKGYKTEEECCRIESAAECSLRTGDGWVRDGGEYIGLKNPADGSVLPGTQTGNEASHLCVTGLSLKIKSVYKGKKYDDTCIAEILPIRSTFAGRGPGYYEKIMKIKADCEGK